MLVRRATVFNTVNTTMNPTTKITDCQDAIRFIPVNSLARNRHIHFFSRVSTDAQDHDKYRAALEAAYNRLNLPMPFTPNVTFHKRTECGQLGKNTKYFTWFAKIIRNMKDVVCIFPALDRLFRPIGYDQYLESDFELFRDKLADLGCNPDNIAFALLNDGTLESDRAFETRLGENYVQNQGQTGQRIDPKTSERLQNEVRTLGELGMTPPDIYFHFAVRLEQVAERTVRKWYKDMGFSSKWDDLKDEARELVYFEGKKAAEIHRRFISRGQIVSPRSVQYWTVGYESFADIGQDQDVQ